ncbi:MAG: family 10 glycosylhydrolase, partial [Candidatus Sumerlaeaceae bacterium]|nr:family 10 glycosylhydrolase [Candidatus Sumerlaeaceae bacterium]
GYPRPATTADTSEGIWVDPGRNDVRQYTRNILKDIVLNYDIDGVIFDRVRYPGDALPHRNEAYGYNPQALSDMGLSNPGPGSTAFINARRQAVANFISEARADVHAIKPWIIVGAAPVVYGTSLTDTYSTVFQYFPLWNTMSNPNHVNGYGILDMVAPQYYRSTASANRSLMDLAKPDVTNMVHQATLYTGSEPAAEMAQSICDTRDATRGMKGFGIFAYSGVSSSGFMTTLNSTSTTPCGTGVMSSPSSPVEYTLKVNWDSTKPNNITNLAASTSQPGRVRLTWSTPSAASDGDLPVRYLVYRSTSTPVKLYYSNLVNRNYDVTGNEFIDEPSKGLTAGTYYYKVIPVDDYNNKGDSNTVGPVSPTFPEFIVETRTGGQNVSRYQEISGDWQNSTSKSTAAGVTAGIGSRFATLDTKNDVARFHLSGISGVPSGAHYYEIYYTTNNVSSTNCANCTYRVKTPSGVVSGTFDVLASTTGNVWYKVVGPILLDSSDGYFEVDSSSSTTAPNGGNTRLPTDAVKFKFVEYLPVTLSAFEAY